MAADTRFDWIAETMHLQPNDRILEIGPGSSDSIAYLAARLDGGRIVGVERSVTAIARAAKRHAALIDCGKVHLLHAGLEKLDRTRVLAEIEPGTRGFDKVVAVNVNLFWTKRPTTELALIRQVLAPDGTLYLFYGYGQPDGHTRTSPKPAPGHLIDYLVTAGFDGDTVCSGDILGVVARPRRKS
ncbi:class I SAM-dependent methyltransferase [Nocardia sp. CA-129566]|uniref:class I SAM-dependent methyltransferase n=1 Tax=Nocardia sp. CA-129566 TaxID=3239976 RepID=UPI003D955A57